MKLTIGDRVAITNTLIPAQANMVDRMIYRGIVARVEVSRDELMASRLSELPGGRLKWDEEKSPVIDVDFNKLELKLLKDQIKRLDTENKIMDFALDVCGKIGDAKENET